MAVTPLDTRLDWKQNVKLATVGANITLVGGAPNALDGHALAVGTRILVKDQTPPPAHTFAPENGVYQVSVVGTGSNGTWVRADDANEAVEVSPGLICFVEAGNINGQEIFILTSPGAIVLGTHGLRFDPVVQAGTNMTRTPGTRRFNATGGSGSGDIKSDGTVAFAANESMGGFKITNLGTPTLAADAATKAYVDLSGGDIKADGTVPFAADESMGGFLITNMAAPVVGTDAVNKTYADSLAGWASGRAVILDLNAANIKATPAFTTFAAAYAAADALATTDKIAILVGEGQAADFGSVTLVANWNPLVVLVGLGARASVVGDIDATNTGAGNGFNVTGLEVYNVGVGNILTQASDGTSNAGDISVLSAQAEIKAAIASVAGTGNGGLVTLTGLSVLTGTDPVTASTVSVTSYAGGTGTGGNITVTNCSGAGAVTSASTAGTSGTVTLIRARVDSVSTLSTNDANDVSLIDSQVAGLIDTRGDGAGFSSGDVTLLRSTAGGISVYNLNTAPAAIPVVSLTDSTVEGTSTTFGAAIQLTQDGGANTAGRLKLIGSRVTGQIFSQSVGGSTVSSEVSSLSTQIEGYFDSIAATSRFADSTIKTASGCILDIDANGVVFSDCTLESTDGTTNEIDAAAPYTIAAFDLRLRVGRSANVTLSTGSDITDSTIRVSS